MTPRAERITKRNNKIIRMFDRYVLDRTKFPTRLKLYIHIADHCECSVTTVINTLRTAGKLQPII